MPYVQFTDSTETVVQSVFSCPQDSTTYPNQATIAATDARYVAFMNPAPTAAQQAQAAMAAGVVITSTGNGAALNGTYACDPNTTAEINAEVTSILLNGTFADGSVTIAWPDMAGTLHTFPSTTEFKAFATAIAAFVSGVRKYATGVTTSLPSNAITIA